MYEPIVVSLGVVDGSVELDVMVEGTVDVLLRLIELEVSGSDAVDELKGLLELERSSVDDADTTEDVEGDSEV